MKSPFHSPRNLNKPSPSRSTLTTTKFRVIKQCPEESMTYKSRKQISMLKKYISELETMMSEKDVQFLYMKGLMQLQHKRGKELEARHHLQIKQYQQKLLRKEKGQSKHQSEASALKSQIQELKSKLSAAETDNGRLKLRVQQIEEQLREERISSKRRIDDLIGERERQRQERNRVQEESMREREREREAARELQKGANQTSTFSNQQFQIIGKIQELSGLIKKYEGTQFVVENKKKIQALRNKMKLDKMESEAQISKLKSEITKNEQRHKHQLREKQNQIRAQMLGKYQSKVNLIPNLKGQIKRLQHKLAQSERTIQQLEHKEFKHKVQAIDLEIRRKQSPLILNTSETSEEETRHLQADLQQR